MSIQSIFEELESFYPKMVEIRRDFHMNPELSFEEVRTPKVIAEYLESIGIEVRRNVGGRGVVGFLKGGKSGKTIALRADFDGLAIQDMKDVPYKSQVPGVMHACGHDGHTTALLAAATVLAKHKENIPGNVVFIHQFAEEKVPGGAISMIEDGCLDGVDEIYGGHLLTSIPAGEIQYCEGFAFASADEFEITVNGRGSHASNPRAAIDPLVTASQLVVNLQTIVSRHIEPQEAGVLSVCKFHCGEATNVISDKATIAGTVRTFDDDTRDIMEQKITEIANGTCMLSGATCDIRYTRGYDSLYNHPKETQYVKQVAEKVVDPAKVIEKDPIMGGEDFAYYLQKVPGSYFYVGAQPDNPDDFYPHHHAMFDFNEKSMLTMAKLFVAVVAHNQDNN